jgi:hypothetical protein
VSGGLLWQLLLHCGGPCGLLTRDAVRSPALSAGNTAPHGSLCRGHCPTVTVTGKPLSLATKQPQGHLPRRPQAVPGSAAVEGPFLNALPGRPPPVGTMQPCPVDTVPPHVPKASHEATLSRGCNCHGLVVRQGQCPSAVVLGCLACEGPSRLGGHHVGPARLPRLRTGTQRPLWSPYVIVEKTAVVAGMTAGTAQMAGQAEDLCPPQATEKLRRRSWGPRCQ